MPKAESLMPAGMESNIGLSNAATEPEIDLKAQKTGPAAFGTEGVMVRDYFAATAPAPPSWWMLNEEGEVTMAFYATRLAEWNFAYADEMMKVRGEDEAA